MTALAPLPIEIEPYEIRDHSLPDYNRVHHQWIYRFPNGYGASVVRGDGTYGYQDGLYEMAVLQFDGDESALTYETPVSDDVMGWLSVEEIAEKLVRIAALPARAVPSV